MNVRLLVIATVSTVILLVILLWWTHDGTKHRGRRFVSTEHQNNGRHGDLYNLQNPITEDYDCMLMSFKPSTSICIYPTDQDEDISKDIKDNGIWKPHMMTIFLEWLREEPELGFIDIGSHIGVYSLAAASLGRDVVAVEPLLESNKRLHKAAQINRVQNKITLLQNAVSNMRHPVGLQTHDRDKARTRIKHIDNSTVNIEGVNMINTILLDDVEPYCRFKSAILKINIVGHEHKAMFYGQGLLDNVDIWIIMMNWDWMRGMLTGEIPDQDEDDYEFLTDLVEDLYDMDYSPRDYKTGEILKRRAWKAWPADIYWEREDYDYEHDEF